MACVFGEMRTLKTSERWSPKSSVEPRNNSKAKCVVVPAGECPSHPLWRPTHRIPPISCTSLFTQSE